MFQIDLKSKRPIYEQIIDSFKRLIVTGALKENDKVPSIRELSHSLTVNPNTIQKAYRELESRGYFYTVLGQGSFIAAPPARDENAKEIRSVYDAMVPLVQRLLFLGETKDDIENFIEKEGGKRNDSD